MKESEMTIEKKIALMIVAHRMGVTFRTLKEQVYNKPSGLLLESNKFKSLVQALLEIDTIGK